MKPHPAPNRAPTASAIGSAITPGCSRSATPAMTAPSAPIRNCPWAPMLNSPALNARPTDRPPRISGTVLTSVLTIELWFPPDSVPARRPSADGVRMS